MDMPPPHSFSRGPGAAGLFGFLGGRSVSGTSPPRGGEDALAAGRNPGAAP